jgi:hypothetical protein
LVVDRVDESMYIASAGSPCLWELTEEALGVTLPF